jgi:hypothetical protein
VLAGGGLGETRRGAREVAAEQILHVVTEARDEGVGEPLGRATLCPPIEVW